MLGGTVLLAVHFYRLFVRMTSRRRGSPTDAAAQLPAPPSEGARRQRERVAPARTRAMDAAVEAAAPETIPNVNWHGVLPGSMPKKSAP